MFCHYCWLFAERHISSYSLNWCDDSQSVGNFNKVTENIEKHEISTKHLQAKYRNMKDETVVAELKEAAERTEQKNRDTLRRRVHVVVLFAKQGLGHGNAVVQVEKM